MQWMQRRPKDNAGECDRMVDQTECVETEKKPCEELGQDTTDDYWGGKVALSSRAVMEEKLGGRAGLHTDRLGLWAYTRLLYWRDYFVASGTR